MLDMNSLLLGVVIAGIGLAISVTSLWSFNRASRFKISWSIGVLFLVAHVGAYLSFAHGAPLLVGALACALLPTAMAFVYVSGQQFVDPSFRTWPFLLYLTVPYLLVVPPIFAIGYDGIALIMQNAVCAVLLFLSGIAYLRPYREAPLAIGSMFALYVATGLSFFACGAVIFANGQWSIGYPPQNWAEEVNVVISILSITGVGTLTLSVDQTRAANMNRLSAMSDPLSGLLNRRGLASACPPFLKEDEAVVLFDLDRFKMINDRFGHAVGDTVICVFADTMRAEGRSMDQKARLGGEEFAMVMRGVSPHQARDVAERISSAFSRIEIQTGEEEPVRCTVSGGVAFGHPDGASLEDIISRADHALYRAKRSGRDRIVVDGDLRLAS